MGCTQLTVEKKTLFLVHPIQIFGPSCFARALEYSEILKWDFLQTELTNDNYLISNLLLVTNVYPKSRKNQGCIAVFKSYFRIDFIPFYLLLQKGAAQILYFRQDNINYSFPTQQRI